MKKTLIALIALSACAQAVVTQTTTTSLFATTENWSMFREVAQGHDGVPVINTADQTLIHANDNHWNKGVAVYTLAEPIVPDAPAHAITLSYTMTPLVATDMGGTLAMYADDCVIAAGVATYGSTFAVGYSTVVAALTSQEILMGDGSSVYGYTMSGNEVEALTGEITANTPVTYVHSIAWSDTENAFVPETTKDGSLVQTQTLGETYSLKKISVFMDGGTGKAPVFSNLTLSVTTPEPATATLSLLALAGLAACRKRH